MNTRRRASGFACLLLACFALTDRSAAAFDAPDGTIRWGIWREGEKIGRHTMVVHHLNGQLVVDHEIDASVRLLAVPVFRYVHRSQEVWRGDALAELIADTNNDGDKSGVEISPAASGIAVEGTAGRYLAPPGTVPSSLWTIDMTKANAVLDVESGKLLAVRFSAGAEEPLLLGGHDVPARHVSAAGGMMRELWYGSDGILVRAQFTGPDGTPIDFRLERR